MDDDWFEGFLDTLDADRDDEAVDGVLRLLSNRHVRYTLYYLSEHPTASLHELTDVVAGLEAEAEGRIITPSDHERIRNRLYHATLPKLHDHGFIQFDATDLTVTRSNVPAPVSDLLDELQ